MIDRTGLAKNDIQLIALVTIACTENSTINRDGFSRLVIGRQNDRFARN